MYNIIETKEDLEVIVDLCRLSVYEPAPIDGELDTETPEDRMALYNYYLKQLENWID